MMGAGPGGLGRAAAGSSWSKNGGDGGFGSGGSLGGGSGASMGRRQVSPEHGGEELSMEASTGGTTMVRIQWG